MKDNKLIAEFMGAKPIVLGNSTEYEMYGILECINDGVDEKHFFIDDEMEFYECWNWLIPVVKKCWKSGAEEDEVGDITHAYLDCDRKETYNAVVEFIKQLNK